MKRIGLFICVFIFSLFSFDHYSMAASENGWVTKKSMPTARYNTSSKVVDGKIYVFGGTPGSGMLKTLEIYDPITDRWTSGAPSNKARTFAGTAAINDKIYIIGGDDSNSNVEVYDTVQNSWTTKQSIPTARIYINAIAVGKQIYTFGGHSSNLVHSYDSENNTWTSKKMMPFSGVFATSFIYNDSIYLTRLIDGNTILYNYDYHQDTWTTVDELTSVKIVKGFNYNGKMVLVGYDCVYTYDLTTNKLTQVPNSEFRERYAAIEIVNDKLYLIGGSFIVNGFATGGMNVVEEFDLSRLNDLEPVENPTLDIESAKNKVFLNETFTVQAVLNNATNIYAEDFNIQYDKTRFQLVSVEAAEHMGLFHNGTISDDTIRLITASKGRDFGINEKGTLVNLTFKAIGLGKGKVDATRGKIADNGTTETTLTEENCGEKEIEVIGGEFSLKHLGFVGYNYTEDKSNLTDDLKGLLGSTGTIEEIDLLDLTSAILANPNYDFN